MALTQEQFETKVRKAHGDNYDLSEAIYVSAKVSVVVTCKICGKRKPIKPSNLYAGKQCKQCRMKELNLSLRSNTEEFIQKAQKIYGTERYLYDRVKYIESSTEVEIYCTVCQKYFWKAPNLHLGSKQGCQTCGLQNSYDDRRYTQEQYLDILTKLYGTTLDFSEVRYTSCKDEVTIICPIHGRQHMNAAELIRPNRAKGCPKCGRELQALKMCMPFSEFKEKANKKHNFRYRYIEETYTKATDYVEIICERHGVFKQEGCSHLSGAGCSICKNSQGELHINDYLQDKGYSFDTQKYFKECRHKGALLFDFYVPELSLLIEYQGRQHYEYVEFFHKTYEGFLERLERDKIKKEYAEKHHNFLCIPYWEFDNIESILEETINKLK